MSRVGIASLLGLVLIATGCGGSPAPLHLPDVVPILRPAIPVQYVSDTVVVPPELADKFAAIADGTSGIDWDTADRRTLSLDWRRAHLYWRYAQPVQFSSWWRLRTFGDRRNAADALAHGLEQGFDVYLDDYFYDASEQRGHYRIRTREPITLGETAWLADWLLSNYPDVIADILPYASHSHGEGGGGDV